MWTNEDEKTSEKDNILEQLNSAIEDVKNKLITHGDFNERVGKRDQENSFVVGNKEKV